MIFLPKNISSIYHKLITIIGVSNRTTLVSIFLLGMVQALLESVSVGLVVPVVGVLIDANQTKAALSEYIDITEVSDNFLQLTVVGIFAFVFTIRTLSSILIKYRIGLDIVKLRHQAHSKLYSAYLDMDYIVHTRRNSSELRRNIDEIGTVFQQYIAPLIRLVSELFIVMGIISILMYNSAVITIVSLIVIGGLLSIVYYYFRNRLSEIGKIKLDYLDKLNRHFYQGLLSIRDIKVKSKESVFSNLFSKNMFNFLNAMRKVEIYSVASSSFIELMVFLGVVALSLFIFFTSANPVDAITMLILFSFALLRLLASSKVIIVSIQSLSVSGESLNLISQEFKEHVLSDETNNITKKLDFVINTGITLSDISYEYPDSKIFSLNKINLSIDVNKSTAIVGATGAGKSTLLDIILTLLEPTSGRYFIDDYELKSTDSISSLISYVPQNIYLLDDSIVNNVAFGVPDNDIDFLRLDNAIRLSSMHEFVEGLPKGVDTIIGENGVQLSGGQRQRLGIARALYEDTQILVLDEATSSLDTVTERKINESILNLSTIKTLIIVTHRIDSVKLCDKIIFMKNGKVENIGSYNSLLIDSPDFKDMSAY